MVRFKSLPVGNTFSMHPHSAYPWKLSDFIDDGATSVGVKLQTLVGLVNVDKKHHIPKYMNCGLIVKKNPKYIDTSVDALRIEAIFRVPLHVFDI